MNKSINQYKQQMQKGEIPKTYRFIMDVMSALRMFFQKKYPDHTVSGLYQGYMDMTYFAVTPPELREKKLKIAIVFLHETCSFELWLAAANRKILSEYAEMLRAKTLGEYVLTEPAPGVDSILVSTIDKELDFDETNTIKEIIESSFLRFRNDMITFTK